MEKVNTIYAECFDAIWDYYFELENIKLVPKVLIGQEKQKELAQKNGIKFLNRISINNIEVEYKYKLSEAENVFFQELISNDILFKMFYRFSIDKKIKPMLFQKLVRNYAKFWFSLIKEFELKVLVLHEMPHLPYTYIGYLVFQYLNLRTFFTVTFPIQNKTYFVDKIEHYSLFENKNGSWFIEDNAPDEGVNYLLKLNSKFQPNQSNSSMKKPSFIRFFLISLRNVAVPSATTRINFKMILNGEFKFLNDRRYHLLILGRTIAKFFQKMRYRSIIESPKKKDEKIRILFALQFEPELAVFPLAGKYNNQYEAILNLSKKLGTQGVILVKEHPWIFDYSRTQGIIRKKNFYKDLNKLQNVCFIDDRFKVSKMFGELDAICSLTGTIGWEAFIKKIPVIYFGYPWYTGLPGIKHFNDIDDINDFIKQSKQDFEKTDYKKIYEVLNESVSDFSVKLKKVDKNIFIEKAKILKFNLDQCEVSC